MIVFLIKMCNILNVTIMTMPWWNKAKPQQKYKWICCNFVVVVFFLTKRSIFRSHKKLYRKLFLTPSFEVAVLLLFVCEYYPHALENNLLKNPTNTIFITSSFWRSVHVYWQIKQCNNNVCLRFVWTFELYFVATKH